MSFEQNEIEWNGRDRAGRIAQSDEGSAAGEPSQCQLGIRSTDRVEDHPGGITRQFADADFQIFAVVVHDGLGSALTAHLEFLRAGCRGQHPGFHCDRQINRRQANTARSAQDHHPITFCDLGNRA